jgi:hypothetical protein
MRSDLLDLVLLIGIVIVVYASEFLGPIAAAPLRIVAGIPLALFAPGYALVCAAWPSVRPHWPKRITLALGVSISIDILAGLLLNLTPQGLQPSTWTLVLGGITLAGCAVTAIRRPQVRWFEFGRPGLASWVASLGAGGLVLAAAVVATAGATAQEQQDTFTQMWIRPDATDGGSANVTLRNLEGSPMSYHVQILDDIGQVTLDIPDVSLNPGETWQTPVTIDPSSSVVSAVAYVGSSTTPYRRVHLVARSPQG